MTITTKTGDDGKSRWLGKVVDKDSPLLEAVGALDELQAVVNDEKIAEDLYQIMGEIAYGAEKLDFGGRILAMEKEIEKLESELPRVNKFLIFKKEEAKNLNWQRAVCRRAERRLVSLSKSQQIDPNILIYINRLSDVIYLLARLSENKATAGKQRRKI